MSNFDFSDCRFIQDNMRYYTYFDFCKNRKEIKELFNELSQNGRIFYMWYVYANTHMQLTYKNAIWDYLNDYDEEGFELMRLKRFYKVY